MNNEQQKSGKPPLPPIPSPKKSESNFWLTFGGGALLNGVSIAFCFLFQSPVPFFIAGAVAFILLFFSKYRMVFVGFIGAIGLALLVSLIACGAMMAGAH